MSLNLARLTLECLRVKALNNELSGQPYYRSGDNPNNYCHCAVGALLPADMLNDIVFDDQNSEDVQTALKEFMGEVTQLTGLSRRMLEDLQNAHDNGIPKNSGFMSIRERANLTVLEFTTKVLATMF